MASGSPNEPCVKISEIRNDSPTTPMKRPSRSTVPSPVSGSAEPFSAAACSGRDSGSFTYTSTAQTSVSAASPRNPAR